MIGVDRVLGYVWLTIEYQTSGQIGILCGGLLKKQAGEQGHT
jgi:hypothetical protein